MIAETDSPMAKPFGDVLLLPHREGGQTAAGWYHARLEVYV